MESLRLEESLMVSGHSGSNPLVRYFVPLKGLLSLKRSRRVHSISEWIILIFARVVGSCLDIWYSCSLIETSMRQVSRIVKSKEKWVAIVSIGMETMMHIINPSLFIVITFKSTYERT